MASQYSNASLHRSLQTLLSIDETLKQLKEWNQHITTSADFTETQSGMQLLAANAMLISAVGEGIKTINLKLPNFLNSHFPDIPWHEIVGMRNRIVHGYFELDADIVLDVIQNGIPSLSATIKEAIEVCETLMR